MHNAKSTFGLHGDFSIPRLAQIDGLRRKNRERGVKARQWIFAKMTACHSHNHYTFNANTDHMLQFIKIIPTSIPFKCKLNISTCH